MVEQVFLAVVLAVIDGDTFRAQIPVWQGLTVTTLVRLEGIDTPEIHGKCKDEKDKALQAKDALAKFLESGMVTLHSVQPDKYSGRVVADVRVDFNSVANQMINQGLARKYSGGERQGWCK